MTFNHDEIQSFDCARLDRRPFRPFAAFMYRNVRDYVLYRDSRVPSLRQQAREALAWIMGGKEAEVREGTILSFENVCEILDRSPELTRAKILDLDKHNMLCREKAFESEEKGNGDGDADADDE